VVCVTVQLMVISDPAIAAEVVHSREFDKVEEAYRSVTKACQPSVLELALHMLSNTTSCDSMSVALNCADDVSRRLPRPGQWNDRRLVAALQVWL
jgi:hypothetical protein